MKYFKFLLLITLLFISCESNKDTKSQLSSKTKTDLSVLSTIPENNAINFDRNKSIEIIFSEPVNNSSVNTTNIKLFEDNTERSISLSTRDATLEITVIEALKPHTDYTLLIAEEVSGSSGNSLKDDYVLSFSTKDSLISCDASEPESTKNANWGNNFKEWLLSHNYSIIAENGGWGGADTGTCTATIDPLIFLHGRTGAAELFHTAKSYFESWGYKPCELYAISWGNTNHHKGTSISLVRKFIQAVKGYTAREKVDIITWSMGATIGRKAIQGGAAYNDSQRKNIFACQLGESISDSVDTFVNVVGVHRGMHHCATSTVIQCLENGFKIDSLFLQDINNGKEGSYNPITIADHTFNLYSYQDGHICKGANCEVHGLHTSIIPGSEEYSKEFNLSDLNNGLNDHLNVFISEITLNYMYDMVKNQEIIQQ